MEYNKNIKKKYIEATKSIKELMANCKEYTVEISDDHVENILNIYCVPTNSKEKNDKKILSAKYEILGSYDTQTCLFYWSKSMPLVDRELTKIVRSIKKRKVIIEEMIIEKTYKDSEYLETILYYLNNNIFYIDPPNVDKFIEFCVGFSECKYVFISKNDKTSGFGRDMYFYYIITDFV